MLTIDVLVGFVPVLFLALAAPTLMAHFHSLQTEFKPSKVRVRTRAVHRD